MVIRRGEIWWADFGEPRGSKAGFRRPVIIVQDDALNRSAMRTTVVVPLTSNLKYALTSTNVSMSPAATGLAKESVAVCALLEAIDRDDLVEKVGPLASAAVEELDFALLNTLGLVF